jgi:transcriptional regulator with XRE-family HTH domain
MAKPFKNLMDNLSPERRERIEDRAQALLIEMALQELRQARHLTQQQLAEMLNLNQAALSKMENQADMRVSTLRRILSAMGGELKIVAQFPDGEVIINQFDSIETAEAYQGG